MKQIFSQLTYPITTEVELDTLHFIYVKDEPMRFHEILHYLNSQPKYEEKQQTVKTLLANRLKSLEGEGLVKRRRRSHKHVEYTIRNRKRVKLLLRFRAREFTVLDRHLLRQENKKTSLNKLHSKFVFNYAMTLLLYQEFASKLLTDDPLASSRTSFRRVKDSGLTYIISSWDVFFDILADRAPEVRDFYRQNLKGVRSDFDIKAVRTENATMIGTDSLVEAWKSRHYARMKFYEYLRESFRECLTRIEGLIARCKDISDHQLEEEAVKSLEKLGAKKLTSDEIRNLFSVEMEGSF